MTMSTIINEQAKKKYDINRNYNNNDDDDEYNNNLTDQIKYEINSNNNDNDDDYNNNWIAHQIVASILQEMKSKKK